MKIFLGCTGRGGELAIFTSIVHAYREKFPDAFIKVATCHNGIYHHIFKNNQDLDRWTYIQFRKIVDDKVASKPYRDPLIAMHEMMNEHNDYEIVENISELTSNKDVSVIKHLYNRINKKCFKLEDIKRKVFMWPTDEEEAHAQKIIDKHGPLVLISYKANSARNLSFSQWQNICDTIGKQTRIAYTGNVKDPEMKGHLDLRGINFPTFYALVQKVGLFIGPDTGTTWMATITGGDIITIRNDPLYRITNTGLVKNGYRGPHNTLEITEKNNKKVEQQVIAQALARL